MNYNTVKMLWHLTWVLQLHAASTLHNLSDSFIVLLWIFFMQTIAYINDENMNSE